MTEENLELFSWYHGIITREEANNYLEGKRAGLFLLRKRRIDKGEYVLSVSESTKVMHYIIYDVNGMYYKIGEQRFADIASVVEFYKRHVLDTTALTEPILRNGINLDPQLVLTHLRNSELCQVKALFNFPGKDPEDLPFNKGDILTIIRKEEEKWWLARSTVGREGMIPATYVQPVNIPMNNNTPKRSLSDKQGSSETSREQSDDFLGHNGSITMNGGALSRHNRSQSARAATVRRNYAQPKDVDTIREGLYPSGYNGPIFGIANQTRECTDNTELNFKRGDKIEVIKQTDDGAWFGRLVASNTTGYFPFSMLDIIRTE